MADIWRLNFNTGDLAARKAAVRRFFHTPDSLASTPANLRLGSDGESTFMELHLGTPEPETAMFFTKADMLAAPPVAGQVAYTYDEDPDFHGRFVADGSSWGARTGPVRSKGWRDPNHRGDDADPYNAGGANLELLIQAFTSSADGTHSLDDIVDQTRNGFPFITDARGLELEYEMRAVDLRLGRTSKILQHFQARVLQHDPMSSEIINGEMAPRYSYLNAVQVADPISDQIMLGQGGFGEPNVVDGVAGSGWRKVRVRLDPRPHFWKMLGAVTGRSGLVGDEHRVLNYVVETPDNFLFNPAGLLANMYMVAFHPVVDEVTRVSIADNRRLRGSLQIRQIALVQPD